MRIMGRLFIDGDEVEVVRAECESFGYRLLVKPKGSSDGPRSQHDVPSLRMPGKFRTNGHDYEWKE